MVVMVRTVVIPGKEKPFQSVIRTQFITIMQSKIVILILFIFGKRALRKNMQTAFKYSDNNCLDIPIYLYYNCVFIRLKLNYDGDDYPYVLQKA